MRIEDKQERRNSEKIKNEGEIEGRERVRRK